MQIYTIILYKIEHNKPTKWFIKRATLIFFFVNGNFDVIGFKK